MARALCRGVEAVPPNRAFAMFAVCVCVRASVRVCVRACVHGVCDALAARAHVTVGCCGGRLDVCRASRCIFVVLLALVVWCATGRGVCFTRHALHLLTAKCCLDRTMARAHSVGSKGAGRVKSKLDRRAAMAGAFALCRGAVRVWFALRLAGLIFWMFEQSRIAETWPMSGLCNATWCMWWALRPVLRRKTCVLVAGLLASCAVTDSLIRS